MRYFPYWYLAFIGCLYLACTPFSLWDQDEAAYAGIAQHMLESGNWIVPEFMWSDVHRKPPLHFWNIAIAYKLFGVHELSVRLSSIVFVLLTYWLVYRFTLRISDKRTASIALVVVSTSLLVPMLARIAVTDGTLLFFFTLCAYALYLQLTTPSWKWVLIFWSSFALALLTKGPPIVLFAGIFAILFFIVYPERKKLYTLHPWFFLPLACLPLIVWVYATTNYDGGKLLSWMIDFYVLKRVNSSMFGQTGPPGTHLVVILFSFLPYALYIPGAVKKAYKAFFQKKEESIFLVAWFVAAWFIYEFSPSKLPSYTVAAHIPFAILIARYSAASDVAHRGILFLHYMLNAVLFAVLILLSYSMRVSMQVTILFGAMGVLLLLLQSFLVLSGKVRTHRILTCCGVSLLLQIGISTLLFPAFEDLKFNTRGVRAAVEQKATPESTVLVGNDTGQPPSLPFYLEQYAQHVKPEYYLSEWIAAYYSENPCVLILKEKQYKALRSFVDQAKADSVASYQLEERRFFNYFMVVNRAGKKQKDSIPVWNTVRVEPPVKPRSYEEYVRMIAESKDWMELIVKKAAEKKLTVEEMHKADAKFIFDEESARYAYEMRIRKSAEWLNDLQVKAKKNNSTIEEMILRETQSILERRNIQ